MTDENAPYMVLQADSNILPSEHFGLTQSFAHDGMIKTTKFSYAVSEISSKDSRFWREKIADEKNDEG